MDNSRNYILDRIMSKKTTIEEFNYDKLEAPPLSWFFSPFDIQELNSIAKSIKYSAKPKERYEAINRVCNRCGLIKFGAGTNRVVYRHPEFPDILFKIAADDVGLGDNPAEYRNQFLLRPFVAKTFEISPCGTVAIVERVNPITSREEYISVADDVFELITEWLIGKYVLADIGSRYFMNVGIRRNFGVVLLDYPYVYELDGNKLYCNKPDIYSPSGKCDGEIDYDDGFNFLVCKKCGAVYKAKELEKKLKNKEIIVEREGDISMKITVKGGSKNLNEQVNTGIGNESFLSIKPSLPRFTNPEAAVEPLDGHVRRKTVSFENISADDNSVDTPKVNVRKIADIKDGVEIPVKEVVAECKVQETDKENLNKRSYTEESVKNSVKIVKEKERSVEKKKVDVKPVTKTVNGVPDLVPAPPVTFSDILKDELNKNAKPEESPNENIDRALAVILENLDKISMDSVRENTIKRLFEKISSKLPNNYDSFKAVIEVALNIILELNEDDYTKANNDENFLSLAKNCFSAVHVFTKYTKNGRDLDVEFDTAIIHAYDEELEDPEVLFTGTEGRIARLTNVYDEDLPADFKGEDDCNPESYNEDSREETVDNSETDGRYTGMKFFDAHIVDVKDMFPAEDRQKVIVFTDENNRYVAHNGEILAADVIDDHTVNGVVIAPKEFVDNMNKIISENNEETSEVVEASTNNVTGVIAPNAGISTEEFLEKEASREV